MHVIFKLHRINLFVVCLSFFAISAIALIS